MEITEKFNLKAKALVIILITLLITGISTMSYAAMPKLPNLAGGSITQMFSDAFVDLVQRGKDYMKKLKDAGSNIDFDNGKLVIVIKDGENVDLNAAIGLIDGELGAEGSADITLEIEREGKEPLKLIGIKLPNGTVKFDMNRSGIKVDGAIEGAEISLVNGNLVIDADAVADTELKMEDGKVKLMAGAGGSVTIEAMGNDLVTISDGREEEEEELTNNVNVTVDIASKTVEAEVNAQQKVEVGEFEGKEFTENVKLEPNTDLKVTINNREIFTKNLRELFQGVMAKLGSLRDGFGAMFNR